MQNRLLFQAYGYHGILAECKFALLRLAAIYINQIAALPEIVVYTDQPAYFKQLASYMPLQLINISNQQITTWKGSINFIHRVKIEIIKDFFTRFDGKVIYADTDTFCQQPLENLFAAISNAQVFMHDNEGNLSQPQNLHLKKWNLFLLQHPTVLHGEISALNTIMWNAGIIGLQKSHLPLLDKVLLLTDKLYPVFSKHTIEQFSFCYTFQNEGLQILSAKDYFFHYWNLKEFRQILISFFEKNKTSPFSEILIASQQLQPVFFLKSKLAFENANPILKLIRKMLFKKWLPNV